MDETRDEMPASIAGATPSAVRQAGILKLTHYRLTSPLPHPSAAFEHQGFSFESCRGTMSDAVYQLSVVIRRSLRAAQSGMLRENSCTAARDRRSRWLKSGLRAQSPTPARSPSGRQRPQLITVLPSVWSEE
jgi:hypothetical protein